MDADTGQSCVIEQSGDQSLTLFQDIACTVSHCFAVIVNYAYRCKSSRSLLQPTKNKDVSMTAIFRTKATILFFAAGLIGFASSAAADDVDDVMALIERYAALEGDLRAQSRLIRADRVMIAGSARQTDQATNMAVQMAQRDASERVDGGPAKWMVRIESPEVRVYGNTAVASFMRLTNIFPANAAPINPGPLWYTLVLVKEGGDWGIAHTHVSPVVPPTN